MKKIILYLQISFRFLKSSKKFSIINIISFISISGVALGVIALVVVLSVFNGFEEVIVNLYNNYHADIRIEPKIGKTFNKKYFPEDEIRSIKNVAVLYDVIEDLALARYENRQKIVQIKAVGLEFLQNKKFAELIIRGNWILKQDNIFYGIFGIGVEQELGINFNDYYTPVFLYAPDRLKKVSQFGSTDFQVIPIYSAATFSAQQEYDHSTIITPLDVAKILYSYETEVSAVEIILFDKNKSTTIIKKIRDLLGDDYLVKDIYQQQEYIYKILKSERLAILVILSFILLIAAFNVIGTLSLIVLEKRRDIAIFHSLGFSIGQIRMIFFVEGMMIVFLGALFGLVIGYLLCFLQMKYGLVSLGNTPEDFIIKYYPVRIILTDVAIIAAIIFIVGTITILFPIYKIQKYFVSLRETTEQK